MYAVLASANRDDTQFPDPETLDGARQPDRHFAFGQGVHYYYCLGARWGRWRGGSPLPRCCGGRRGYASRAEPGDADGGAAWSSEDWKRFPSCSAPAPNALGLQASPL